MLHELDCFGRGRAWREDGGEAGRLQLGDIVAGDCTATKDEDVIDPTLPEQLHDPWEQVHMSAGKTGHADSVHVFLNGRAHDHLRRLPKPGVDDLHPGVAESPGDDL